MSKSNEVLAPSATMLTQSVSEDNFWAALPAVIAKLAGVSYEGDNSTMKLERVTLNKQALIDRVKRLYRAQFAAVYAKPDKGGEAAWKLPVETYERVKEAVEMFVVTTMDRLNSGKWEVTNYNRGYAWSTKHDSYLQRASVTSELLIDVKEQNLAATIDNGVCERKLEELRKKNIGDDDIRIVNAVKRLDATVDRLAKLKRKLAELDKVNTN